MGVTAPDTCRAWVGTLCMSFQGTGSNSLGHLNGMKLNEKKNLDLSLNEGKKTLVGLCLGESDQGGRFPLSIRTKFLASRAIRLWKGLLETK